MNKEYMNYVINETTYDEENDIYIRDEELDVELSLEEIELITKELDKIYK